MKLYNVLTQQTETFAPQSNAVKIYVCGITPYDTTHLGHAFTYLTFDILIRYLEYQGYRVRYAQNVTDIDDDILRKAGEVGENWQVLGNRWTAHFIKDMQSLNMRPPDHYPRATDMVVEIIETVHKLLEAGVAYEAGGSVYFDVTTWPRLGQLSRLSPAELLPLANQRGNHPDDPHKRQPLDFVLWQAQQPGEPAWNSPWGPGRPGWHIECSTMSTRLLGNTLDIHGGGADLVFPHHECEMAQSESATGQSPFVRWWLHAAMVYHDGEKMSKSLGNLIMVRDLLSTWSPDALRLYLASHHYRQSWSFSLTRLKKAQQLADKLNEAVTIEGGHKSEVAVANLVGRFIDAMDNDLDSPAALVELEHVADRLIQGADDGQAIDGAQTTLRSLAKVFGLRLDAPGPERRVMSGWAEHLRRFE